MKSSRKIRPCRWQALIPATVLAFVAALALAQPQRSAPASNLIREAGLKVVVRDGAELALEVYRPDGGLQRPTLYAAGPLPLPATRAAPDLPQTGPVAWWVEQGFNVVLLSTRGTGASSGQFDFMGREEQQDHYEVIEWIAQQPWSDGQVAGLGAGYYGTSQWFMAIQNPPHLSCIAPVAAVLDPWADWFMPGGLSSTALLDWYETEVREAWAWPQAGEPRLVDFDLQRQLLEHRLPDAWWEQRRPLAQLDQVRVPVFQAGSWRQQQPQWSQTLTRLDRLPRNSFTWVGNSEHLLQDRLFLENELLPWYRWCFSGKPRSGPALQPLLRYQVVNGNTNRASTRWPPANINFTALHGEPGAGSGMNGLLLPEVTDAGRNRTRLQQDGEALTLTLSSAPLATAVDLAGPLLLQFHASSAALDAGFEAELYEEVLVAPLPRINAALPDFLNPEPVAESALATRLELISSGRFKASVRDEIDGPEATPVAGDPLNPSQLYPGRIYRFDLALAPRAWRLRPGSRLVLKFRASGDPSLRQLTRDDTLYHSRQYPMQLWLPLSADSRLQFRDEGQPVPALAPATRELFEGDNPVILMRPPREPVAEPADLLPAETDDAVFSPFPGRLPRSL